MSTMARRTVARVLCSICALAVAGCATSNNAPEGSTPADKLRKAEADYDLHGELEVTVSRTR